MKFNRNQLKFRKKDKTYLKTTYTDQVYVVSNPLFPYYKIGRTKNMTHRLSGLNNTSIPVDYQITLLFSYEGKIKPKLESVLHNRFQEQRIRPDREFFRLTESDLLNIIDLAEKEGYTTLAEDIDPNFVEKYELIKKVIKRGLCDSVESFLDWFEKFVSALESIEMQNNRAEYKKYKAREDGYMLTEEEEYTVYYDDAIEQIKDSIGGNDELIGLTFDYFPLLYHNIEEVNCYD